MSREFFEEMSEASEVKAKIVSDYFSAWVTIMNKKAKSDRLAYIDLYSGPGRYEDGSKSTPLRVMDIIIENDELSQKMVTFLMMLIQNMRTISILNLKKLMAMKN